MVKKEEKIKGQFSRRRKRWLRSWGISCCILRLKSEGILCFALSARVLEQKYSQLTWITLRNIGICRFIVGEVRRRDDTGFRNGKIPTERAIEHDISRKRDRARREWFSRIDENNFSLSPVLVLLVLARRMNGRIERDVLDNVILSVTSTTLEAASST